VQARRGAGADQEQQEEKASPHRGHSTCGYHGEVTPQPFELSVPDAAIADLQAALTFLQSFTAQIPKAMLTGARS